MATSLLRVPDKGRSVNLVVMAEGVETPEQRDFLKGRDRSRMQGYHRGRALAASNCSRLLRSGKHLR